MKRRSFIIFGAVAALPFLLASCDEGRLYPSDEPLLSEEGGIAAFHGELSGLKTWTSDYTVALAGFEDGNEFALISKNLSQSENAATVDVVMTGIPREVSTIELCVIDRLRRRIATFSSTDFQPDADTLRICPDSSVDLSMAGVIQRDILNTTCANCHGRSSYAAAGLNLTEGRSFTEMVGVPSSKVDGIDRVTPGNSGGSLLYRILAGDESSGWRYDHSVEIVRSEKLDLIRNWIDAGARY